MIKPICFITAPASSRSGYGEMSRSIIRSIIAMNKYEIHLNDLPWGLTPANALISKKDNDILSLFIKQGFQLSRQPEIHLHVGLPNESAKVGKFNILYTAFSEIDRLSKMLLETAEQHDLIITISEHTKKIAVGTIIDIKDQNQNLIQKLQITKPTEVIQVPIDTSIFRRLEYKEVPTTIQNMFVDIKEKFCFLFVGHWMSGAEQGEDRKNVSNLVKIFCETFKNTSSGNMPALILKTSRGAPSLMDREEVIKLTKQIKDTVQGPTKPNVYIVHGELTPEEMSGLYNHPKVKCHVNIARGESQAVPLLEASMTAKPIICSAWGGMTDFLNPKDAIFVGGQLKPIHSSAIMENILIPEGQWFNPDPQMIANALMHVFKNYDNFTDGAKKLAKQNKEQFNIKSIEEKTKVIFDKYIPEFKIPQPVVFNLPKLRSLPTIQTSK